MGREVGQSDLFTRFEDQRRRNCRRCQDRSAAQAAGIASSVKFVAINNRAYTATILHDAMKAYKKFTQPMEFLLRDGDIFKTVNVIYHGGERYPQLEREASKPDLLTAIIQPLAK